MSDLKRGLEALANSRAAYEEAEGYYTGSIGEFFSSDKIRNKLAGTGSHFRINFAAVAVDARIDRLEVASLTVPGSDVLTKLVNSAFWEANDLDEDSEDFFRKAAYFGDYYLTVWEGETDTEGTPSTVDVFGNSPLAVRVIYSRENTKRPIFAVKTWETDASEDGRPRFRVNLYYRDRIEPYVTKPGGDAHSVDDFEPLYEVDDEGVIDESSWPIENTYGVIPVFHLRQGGKPYGVPVHKRGWGAQDSINKLNLTHMGTIDFQGFPQRWALVDDLADDDGGDDDFDVEFETTGVVTEVSGAELRKEKGKLKSGPGETWWLRGIKEVGQFDPAGHEPFLEPIKFQVRAMAVLTSTPVSAFDPDGGGQTSGELRRREDAPLTKSVSSMQRAYGQTIENAASFALAILGYAGQVVKVAWRTGEVSTDKEDWETAKTKLSSGVPLRSVLGELGYSTEDLEAWYPGKTPALAPATMIELGTALVSMSQSGTLGSGITPEDIRAAMPHLFAADRPEAEVSRAAPEPEDEDDDLDEDPAPGGE